MSASTLSSIMQYSLGIQGHKLMNWVSRLAMCGLNCIKSVGRWPHGSLNAKRRQENVRAMYFYWKLPPLTECQCPHYWFGAAWLMLSSKFYQIVRWHSPPSRSVLFGSVFKFSNFYCFNLHNDITSFISIKMIRGTDIILHNISTFRLNVRSIMQNIVSPA